VKQNETFYVIFPENVDETLIYDPWLSNDYVVLKTNDVGNMSVDLVNDDVNPIVLNDYDDHVNDDRANDFLMGFY
jgi:hypothetical protein